VGDPDEWRDRERREAFEDGSAADAFAREEDFEATARGVPHWVSAIERRRWSSVRVDRTATG
jgi:hypothetical protein